MIRMRAFRTGQIVGLGFGLILLLALFIGLLGRVAFDISRSQRDIVQTRGDVERLALQLVILSNKRSETLRRYMGSGNVSLLAAYQTNQSAYADIFSRLQSLLNSPAEIKALNDVIRAEAAFNHKADEILELYNSGFPAAARFLWDSEGVGAEDDLVKALDNMRQVQGRTSASVTAQARQNEYLVVVAVSIFIFLVFIGGVIASLMITRYITRPISSLVATVNTLATDLTTRVEPYGPEEVAFLGETINEMAGNLYNSRLSLQAYKDRVEDELALASQIQVSFLPATLPQTPELELAVYWKSAREVGGDFYQHVELEDGLQGIAVGDVSGKGTAAAMVGALALGVLNTYAVNFRQPDAMLAALNQDLCVRLVSHSMNVACCYAIIDTTHHCLSVANAGCIYPYLIRGGSLQEITIGGLPLGAWSEFVYPVENMALQRDDLIIFSSDGLVEAQNARGELLGFERFQAELARLPQQVNAQLMVNRLVKLVQEFTGHLELYDDITILVAHVKN